MIGGDPRSIPGAPAAEHGQSEHARLVADAGAFHKLEIENGKDMCHPATRQVWRPTRRKHQAPKSKLQRSTNIQTSNLEAKDLELGVCCFSGAWCWLLLWSLVLGIWSLLEQPRDLRVRQRQHARLLRAVIEGSKRADLFEPAHGVQGVEELRVARGQLRRLEITAPQIRRLKRARILGGEKMEAEP